MYALWWMEAGVSTQTDWLFDLGVARLAELRAGDRRTEEISAKSLPARMTTSTIGTLGRDFEMAVPSLAPS